MSAASRLTWVEAPMPLEKMEKTIETYMSKSRKIYSTPRSEWGKDQTNENECIALLDLIWRETILVESPGSGEKDILLLVSATPESCRKLAEMEQRGICRLSQTPDLNCMLLYRKLVSPLEAALTILDRAKKRKSGING